LELRRHGATTKWCPRPAWIKVWISTLVVHCGRRLQLGMLRAFRRIVQASCQ